MWSPRNLNSNEQKAYNIAMLEASEAEEIVNDLLSQMRKKYNLPPEAGYDPVTGVFVVVKSRVTPQGTVNTPEELNMGEIDPKEKEKIAAAQAELQIKLGILRRTLNNYRRVCEAPATAMLSPSFTTWIDAETRRPFNDSEDDNEIGRNTRLVSVVNGPDDIDTE